MFLYVPLLLLVCIILYLIIVIVSWALLDDKPNTDASGITTDSNIRVTVIGLARDIMPGALSSVPWITELSKRYTVRAVYMENGSKDDSRNFLEQTIRNIVHEMIIVGCPDTPPPTSVHGYSRKGRGANRIGRMCWLRNGLLKRVPRDTDIIVMHDPDLHLDVDITKLLSAIESLHVRTDVYGITGLGLKRFWLYPFRRVLYDTYAYSDSDVDKAYAKSGFNNDKRTLHIAGKKFGTVELFPNSNFGGIAVYKACDVLVDDDQYTVLPSGAKGEVHCEHRTFSDTVAKRTGKKLSLDPTWQNNAKHI